MWHCPKCDAEVDDAVPYCYRCGTLPEDAPRPEPGRTFRRKGRFRYWQGDDPFLPPYRVSRQFSIGRLIRLTAFCAVVCALLSVLQAIPSVYVVLFGFIAIVGLAQVFAYSGHRPRRASIIVGMILGLPLAALISASLLRMHRVQPPRLTAPDVLNIVLFIAYGLSLMGVLAYLAGWIVVGVFLGREVMPGAKLPQATPDSTPTDSADSHDGSLDGLQRPRPTRSPSQYGPGRMLLRLVPFALVLIILGSLGADLFACAVVFVAVLVTVLAGMAIVAVTQATAFGGKNSRIASAVAGAAIVVVIPIWKMGPSLLGSAIGGGGRTFQPDVVLIVLMLMAMLTLAAAYGGLIGYLIGFGVSWSFLFGERPHPTDEGTARAAWFSRELAVAAARLRSDGRQVARGVARCWRWLDQTLEQPSAGVTRRYGLDRLMIITALFALLFALLRTVSAPPMAYASMACFTMAVAVAQSFLFYGKKPRKASIVVGCAAGVLFMLSLVADAAQDVQRPFIFSLGIASYTFWPAVVMGGFAGYLIGCVVAGAFLGRRQGTLSVDDSSNEAPLGRNPGDT